MSHRIFREKVKRRNERKKDSSSKFLAGEFPKDIFDAMRILTKPGFGTNALLA